SLNQQTYPLAHWPGAEAPFQLCFQRRADKALHCLPARDGNEALELRLLRSQKEPGVRSTIQALEWPPALRLWPAGFVPDLAFIGLHIWYLEKCRGVAKRRLYTLSLTRLETMEQSQPQAKGAQQTRTIVINSEGLPRRPVSATPHAGLHTSDRLGVRLVAWPVLPRTAIAKSADR